MTFTPEEAKSEWIYISTIKETNYTSHVGKTLITKPGKGNRTLQEVADV